MLSMLLNEDETKKQISITQLILIATNTLTEHCTAGLHEYLMTK